MPRKAWTALSVPKEKELEFNPLSLIPMAGKNPSFDFVWKDVSQKAGEHVPTQRRKKRRLIGRPNSVMKRLHQLFNEYLEKAINDIGTNEKDKESYTLRKMPSATGCVPGSNPYVNAKKHIGRRFCYITDFADAYPSVDLHRLTTLLVFIFKHSVYGIDYAVRTFARNELAQFAMEADLLFPKMYSFVQFAFGGLYGKGLAVGGTLSPYLLNLYCEVYLDSRIRQHCEKTKDLKHPEKELVYSRYVDDLVFSSSTIISSERRGLLRQFIVEAGFHVNHRKSKVLDRSMGAVHITKVGLEESKTGTVIRFPQKKRRRIEGMMKSYLAQPFQQDKPEITRGMIAEFLYYYSQVTPTASDERTMKLCRKFNETSAAYRKRYKEQVKRLCS